jgi:hypothetical protein
MRYVLVIFLILVSFDLFADSVIQYLLELKG